jgi:hypothetical protein
MVSGAALQMVSDAALHMVSDAALHMVSDDSAQQATLRSTWGRQYIFHAHLPLQQHGLGQIS